MNHSIVTWNVRALTGEKVVHLRRFLQERWPLAVVLTETHRCSASPADWPRFRGYTLFPLPGQSNHAGGMAFLIRADCTAWTGPAESSAITGLNTGGRSAINPDTSSQWAALELEVHGHCHPIWLIGAYLQPPVSAAIRTELVKQLRASVDRHAQLVRADQNAPQMVLCGDFNQHDFSLCEEDHAAHSELLEDLQRLGFRRCCSAEKPATHSSGHVLDLFFELVHPATMPLLRCVNVDNSAERVELPGSDHFAVSASLVCRSTPPSAPAHTFYKWKTEALAADTAAAFTADVELACSGNDLGSDHPLDALVQSIANSFSSLHGFNVVHHGANNSYGATATTRNYKERAQPIADAAWIALSSVVHTLAQQHIGQRQRDSTDEKGWTKELHLLRKTLLRAEAAWRRDCSNQSKTDLRCDARRVYRQALAEKQRKHWDALRSAVEEAPPQRRNRIAWHNFAKYRKAKEFSQFVAAGIKRADGTATRTEEDSRRSLAAHFQLQMSPHECSQGLTVDTTESEFELAHSALPPLRCKVDELTGEDRLTTVDKLRDTLSRSSTQTAAGPDELNGALIRLAAQSNAFMQCVTALMNFCFAFHVLPQGWRDANLMPLLKKNGDPRQCGSYRPISITSLLMRRMERLMEDRVRDKLDKQLSPWQAGFRRCRSTRQQILFLQQRVARATRRSTSLGRATPYPVAFLDISRAFDSVPHKYLLHKLFRAGIHGHDLQFFAAFLTGRRFRIVTLNGMDDCWTEVLAGVPQGAVLSPLLYAVFINDSHEQASATVALKHSAGYLLYADDMALAPNTQLNVTERHAQLQEALTALGDWARKWGVRFSATKSGVMWFFQGGTAKHTLTTARALPPLSIQHADGPAIHLPFVEAYQYLGVWLNAKLTSHTHFRHVLEKCTPMSALLRRVQSPDAPPGPDVVRALVKAVLLPRITYGLPFFTPTKQMCARLDALLFRPLQTALALPMSVHRASLAVYTQLPVVQLQRDKELLLLVGSILRLVHEPTVRTAPGTHPVFRMLWRSCNQSAAAARYCKQNAAVAASGSAKQQFAGWDTRSPVDLFLTAVNRSGLNYHLPAARHLKHPPTGPLSGTWWHRSWKDGVRMAVEIRSLARMLHESEGYQYSYRGWAFGCVANPTAPSETHKFGTELAHLLGIPRCVRVDVGPGELTCSAINLVASNLSFSARTLGEEHKRHAQLRARITLNRSAFNAVRALRSKDPLAPRLCRQCPATPPETARHVLVSCPRYSASRDELKKQLREVIERIRKAKQLQSRQWRRCIQHDDELLFHIILATPLVLAQLSDSHDRAYLLRCTADFLLSVHDIRPT